MFPAKVSIKALVEATRKQRPRLETSARALDTDTKLARHVYSHIYIHNIMLMCISRKISSYILYISYDHISYYII